MIQAVRSPWLLGAALALSMLLGSDSTAEAAPQILRPSTRPMFFTGGVGPVFWGLTGNHNRYGYGYGGYGYHGVGAARFKVGLDWGYHFSGRGEGPAIGAVLEQSFDGDFYVFNPGFKFWYDIQISDMAIYVAPLAKAGYTMATWFSCGPCSTGHFFNLGVGAEGRVVLGDRGMLFLRPIQLDSYFGSDVFGSAFLLNYSAMIGGGVTF